MLDSHKTKMLCKLFAQFFLFQAIFSPTAITYSQSLTKISDPIENVNSNEIIVTTKSELTVEPRVPESSSGSASEEANDKNKNTSNNKSTESNNSVYWIAPGLALGAVVLAGIASGSSGSNNDSGSAEQNITFKSPIRIGDDQNYNENHTDNFQINSPSGITYSESFEITGNFSKGTLSYTIAGATEGNRIYINNHLVGRTCNPGNTAYVVRDCPSIDVTSRLKIGTNVLKIACVLYPGDEVTPYDDIEIYNMRLNTN